MKKLYLITKTFPLGTEEKAFLQYEVELLENNFDLTIVVTEQGKKSGCENDIKYNVVKAYTNPKIWEKIISAIRFLLKREAWEEFARIIKGKKLIVKRLFRALMFGTAAETFWKKLKMTCNIHKDIDAVFYFYWWDYKCLGVTMYQKKYPNMRVVTRTHGYDLYDERELYGKQFFKKQMERNLKKIFFISEYGKRYYEEHSGKKDDSKYELCRLGVKEQSLQHKVISTEFLMVSCSNVIPLKRVELIVEGLSQITDTKVKWIHFGDGEELEKIEALAGKLLDRKENISYRFAGRVDNQTVMNFYRDNSIGCFITTTSTEGNPVSVQEALSFGIPVIGTTVSDIPLMIEGNGVLLSEDPKPEEVAEAIMKIADASEAERKAMSERAYEIWKNDYDAEKNYNHFIEVLLKV